MKVKENKLILALETAVRGGSISLLEGEAEIDFWVGKEEFLRAQDFLFQIRNLLEKNGINPNRIAKIVVATGPGSFTGLRIGISIALGLKTAWNCTIMGANVLEAMIFFILKTRPITTRAIPLIISAIPFGKREVCWQISQNFGIENQLKKDSARISVLDDFLNFIDEFNEFALIAEESLFKKLMEAKSFENEKVMINPGRNLARFVGMKATQDGLSDITPVYVQR